MTAVGERPAEPPGPAAHVAFKPCRNGLTARLNAALLGFEPKRLWNPSPSERHRTEPYEIPARVEIGVRGTPESGARFSPPPFAVIVEADAKRALVAVSADRRWHRWNKAVFVATAAGARVEIDLEGMTDPNDAREHVRIWIFPGDEDESRHALLARGLTTLYPEAAVPPRSLPKWWTRPIYCGWGDQVALSMWLEGLGPERRALAYCIQGLYERWIARLERAEVPIGTVIVDAGWSPPGSWEPIPTMWPDLRGFIARQHEKGRHVLLWLAVWLYDGLPDRWCVRLGERIITADPTNPDYIRYVRRQIRRLIAAEGFDADGFKIDQLSHCPTTGPGTFGPRFGWMVPSEPGGGPLQMHGDGFGCELLYTLQKTIHDAAKEAKADALITSSTVHPYFHDSFDMVRLHDMGTVPEDIFIAMRARADLARAALPGKPVDADGWLHTDYDMWMRYTCGSHCLGVPCTFYAERFMNDWRREPATKLIPMDDLRTIARAWREAGFA